MCHKVTYQQTVSSINISSLYTPG